VYQDHQAVPQVTATDTAGLSHRQQSGQAGQKQQQQQQLPAELHLASAGIAAGLASGAASWLYSPQQQQQRGGVQMLEATAQQQLQQLLLQDTTPDRAALALTGSHQVAAAAAPGASSNVGPDRPHTLLAGYQQDHWLRQQQVLLQQQLYSGASTATNALCEGAAAVPAYSMQQQQMGVAQLLASCLAASGAAVAPDAAEDMQPDYGPC
jgi:hypothetical protein